MQNPSDEKINDYIRVKPEDAGRIVRLTEILQKDSLGHVYKNIVISQALDALERELGLEAQTTH
jgi:hypothetical protein